PAPPRAYRCNALVADPAGGLWIGTDAHGLVRWDEAGFSSPIMPGGGAVWALAVEPAGRLWVGSYFDGVFAKHGSNWFHRGIEEGLINNRVYALAVARDGAVWIGTDRGVSRYVGDRFENFTTNHGFPAGAVRAIAQDASGDMWFGTVRTGLARWRHGRFELFTRADGLSRNSIRSLLADADGTLWIGTGGSGLSRWRDGHFVNFQVEDGLPDGLIVAIVDDGLGYLWFSSGQGIFRVARANLESFARRETMRLECTRYLKDDGLMSMQCSDGSPSGIRTSDGRLWFTSAKGLSVVNPRELRPNPVPPPVQIEEVLVDGKPQALPTATIPLTVPAGRRRLEIRYSGLSFTAPDRVRFKQRLEGFDNAWQDAGEQRAASFQGLRPGNYRFRVIAANNDGVWNHEGASLAFSVQPELWQTIWFRGLVLLGCLGAVAGVSWG